MSTAQRREAGAPLAFDPTDRHFVADPYRRYAELREQEVLHVTADGAAVLTRHEQVIAALRDHRLSSDPRHATDARRSRRLADFGGDVTLPIMLFLDPPDHTRLRRLANKAFTPRAVEALRPRIARLVTGFLDEAEELGDVDVMAALAFPLPVVVICELLGVPADDQEQFKGWSASLARALDAVSDPSLLEQALPAVFGFVQYFSGLIEQRRSRPGDDLLSALIAAEEQGDQLSTPELFAMCILLFVAGHETTTNLIGNGVLALLRHRDQFAALREDPELAGPGTEELLRYDAPVQVTGRTATCDLEIDGIPFAKGEGVVMVLASANRDARVWPDPDRLVLSRGNSGHVAFGNGVHYCLGAPLARVEGQEVFGAIARRFPKIELSGEPVYRDHFVLRGLARLPVALR